MLQHACILFHMLNNRCHNLPPSSTLTYPIITLPSTRRTREYSSDLSQTPNLDLDSQVSERENTMYPTELMVCLPPIQGNSLSPTSSSGHSFHQTSSDNSRRLSTWFNHTSLMSNASSGSIEVETPTSLSELRVRLPPITENNSNLSRSSSRISTGIRGSEPMRTTPSIQGRK